MEIPSYAYYKPQNGYPILSWIKEISRDGIMPNSLERMVLFLGMKYHWEIGLGDYQKCESNKLPQAVQRTSFQQIAIKEGKGTPNIFHRVGKELIFALEGICSVWCEDLRGKQETYVIGGNKGLYVPPFVLHTYNAQIASKLLIISDITFEIGRETYDTYAFKIFKELQGKMK